MDSTMGKIKIVDKVKQGKKNRASGSRFELKVRKDLESKGWIVSKWMNNVKFTDAEWHGKLPNWFGELIPAKHKFRGPGIPMAIGTGFPDFIAFQIVEDRSECADSLVISCDLKKQEIKSIQVPSDASIMGVEVKYNGYLDKEEKEKCKWLLKNNIFSKILVASKGTKRGEIVYKEFE